MFESRGIQFALIGGLAVSLRGQPRMTVDVHLLILADVDQALGLVRELASTPFEPLFAGVEEVVTRSYILPLRHRILMKALAGRPQDEQDIRGLIAAQGDAIDWPRCLALARQLGEAVDIDVAGRLEAARGRKAMEARARR